MIGHEPNAPYSYGRIRIDNPMGRRVGFRMQINMYPGGKRIVIRDQAIEPGGHRFYNIPLPMVGYGFEVNVTDTDGRVMRQGAGGVDIKTVLDICAVEEWATEKEMQDFTAEFNSSGSDMARRGSGSGSPNIVSQLEPVELPGNWMCYAPFKAVFVNDSAFRHMTPTARAALLQWVDAGGWLTIYGSAEESIRPSMLGTIHKKAQSPIRTKSIQNEWRRAGAPWMSYYGQTSSVMHDFPYLIQERGGQAGGFILATVFCIFAGPLNLIYWRRRRRIRMLMITVPLISIGFCLVIAGYFLASQGFTKRGGTMSVTILDEATDSAITFSRHVLYSGLYPMGGFKFDADTAFYPLKRPEERDSFGMDWTSGKRLQSGLFVPSFNFHYFTTTPYKTRERLIFDLEEKSVINGFEVPIRGLAILDGNNTHMYAADKIAPGAKAELRLIAGNAPGPRTLLGDVQKRVMSSEEALYLSPHLERLFNPMFLAAGPRYIVALDGATDYEQPGVRIGTTNHCHVLVGVAQKGT